jgi:hypothetical protein
LSTVEFSFGQIEAVCANLNRIASDRRVAFVGRLKQLQKQGLTKKASRPGRGRAGTYSFGDLMRFVIALELIQAGIMPQMAAKLVNGSWSLLRGNIYACSFAPEDTVGFVAKPTEYLWMLSVEALRSLTREGEQEWDHMERIQAVPVEDAGKVLMSGVGVDAVRYGEGLRTLVLNGYNLTQRVMRTVAFVFGWATRQQLRDDLEAEMRETEESYRKFAKLLEKGGNLLTEEQSAALAVRLRETMETDFSTSPPTPRSVYVERARDVMRFLPEKAREFLGGPEPQTLTIHEEEKEMLRQLIDLGVIEIEAQESADGLKLQGIGLSPFGEVLVEEIGGEWGKTLAAKRRTARRSKRLKNNGNDQKA